MVEDHRRLLIAHKTGHVWERLGRKALCHSEVMGQQLGLACAFCTTRPQRGLLKKKTQTGLAFLEYGSQPVFFILQKSTESNLLLIFAAARQAEPPAIFW